MQNQKEKVNFFVGESSWMDKIRTRIHQVADYNYGVLISGPSGTGKELVARAIHNEGKRAESPFIPVNCAAIPAELFSSQLFGHTKGAFTGAQYESLGCFRAADGGTIFLDEIGELDLDCQAKLLRVLQEKVVTPVGGHQGHSVDVRTIAATNRDLSEEVRAGRFRLDLFYRLNVLSLETLGLAERTEDIRPLVNHFLAKTAIECGLPLKSISDDAILLLTTYGWPGNVRELENFIERAVVMTDGDEIGPDAFPEIMASPNFGHSPMPGGYVPPGMAAPQGRDMLPTTAELTFNEMETPAFDAPAGPVGHWPTLAEMECQHIEKTLKEAFYNKSAAARMLGVDRKLLSRKIKKYGIELPKSAEKGKLKAR